MERDNGSYKYYYQYKDHLGNIRVTYDNSGSLSSPNASIVDEHNYYPFGLEHKGYNNVVNGTENNYQTYLGQEFNKELGLNWLTFRHRNYMPEIGRFFGVDPVAADYVSISTYQFAHNNPISKIELEGLEGHQLYGVDVINASPLGRSAKNRAAHLPLPVGNQSGNSSKRASNKVVNSSSDGYIKTSGDTFQSGGGKAYVAKGSIESQAAHNLGSFSGEGRVLGASAYNNTGDGSAPLAVSLGAETSTVEANANLRIGSPAFGVVTSGEGSLLSAESNLDLGIFTGEGGLSGPLLDANAGAFVAEGEFSFGYSILGVQVESVLGGSFASAHAGLTVGSTYDAESGNLTIEGIEHLGFGAGEKAGIKITIPFNWLMESNDNK